MRRILIAVTVDDDADRNDLADEIPFGSDPTVWEWQDFWADARDGVVSPAGDNTRTEVEDDEDDKDDEPKGAGVACECGSFLHGKCH